MATDPEFGRRLRQAKREWEQRHDCDLPQGELAQRVAQRAGVDNLSAQAVGYWLNKGQEPSSFALLRAVANVLEVSVAWLVGEGTEKAAPSGAASGPLIIPTRPGGERIDTSERPVRKRTGGGTG